MINYNGNCNVIESFVVVLDNVLFRSDFDDFLFVIVYVLIWYFSYVFRVYVYIFVVWSLGVEFEWICLYVKREVGDI